MKKSTIISVLALVTLALLASCQEKKEAAPADAEPAGGTSKADISYAFGVAVGESLKQTGVEIDYKRFLDGVRDHIEKEAADISLDESQAVIQMAIMDVMQKKADENKKKEADFLAENGKKAGVVTTASGLQYEIIKQGTGPKPIETDTVKVDYVGTFMNGDKFDSSIDAGEPAVFPVGMVIPGWVEALQLMPVGSKFKLYIPSALAYGEEGSQGAIEPNTPLIFEVELLSIEPPEASN